MNTPGMSLYLLSVGAMDFRHSRGVPIVDVVKKITQREETDERDAISGRSWPFQLCGDIS